MRIRIAIISLVAAIAAVGCSSLRQDYAGGGSLDGTADFGPGSENVVVSETALPDYRETLADPGF